jgi:hypothetical protein
MKGENMATGVERFLIQFPEGYDERLQYETPFKGYLDGVVVQLEDGSRYRLCFYDSVRLQQTLEDDIQAGRPYLAEPGLVVVPEVTTEAIRNAIQRLWQEGFFHHLKPLPRVEESRSF